MTDTTIISLVDNNLDPDLWSLCKDYLIWAAEDIPIISVSQKPIDLGTNICVGNIGRKMESVWMQALAGAEAATTRFVAMAAQDNLYPRGCFAYQPSRDDMFYYNFNYVFFHYKGEYDGMFGVNNEIRTAFSQMVCNRQLLVDALSWAIGEVDSGNDVKNKDGLIMEPGAWKSLFCKDRAIRFTGYDFYWDKWPSVDIRHDRNFTKYKRFYKMLSPRSLYWGSLEDIWNKKPMTEPCLEL